MKIGTNNPKYGYNIHADENINDNTYFRESYRQLKVAMERQGNVDAALKFKAKELFYLRKELPFGWDSILLYCNYYSDNHGLSWSRAVLFTLIISYLFFIAFEATIRGHQINFIVSSLHEFGQMFSFTLRKYFEFLSAFPLFKNQTASAISWVSYLILILSRIGIGYGVYQAISAFRKFSAKK